MFDKCENRPLRSAPPPAPVLIATAPIETLVRPTLFMDVLTWFAMDGAAAPDPVSTFGISGAPGACPVMSRYFFAA